MSAATVKARGIQTRSGRFLTFLDPQPEDIVFADVASSLTNICRFTGHCPFYSVAEHSFRCSEIVKEKLAGEAFGHDFAEMLLGDIPTPLKRVLEDISGGAWSQIESHVERVFAERFGLRYPIPNDVKQADLVMLATEKRDLLVSEHLFAHGGWVKLPQPLREVIIPFSPESVYQQFVDKYQRLHIEGLIL